jgi:hypothetical protein
LDVDQLLAVSDIERWHLFNKKNSFNFFLIFIKLLGQGRICAVKLLLLVDFSSGGFIAILVMYFSKAATRRATGWTRLREEKRTCKCGTSCKIRTHAVWSVNAALPPLINTS